MCGIGGAIHLKGNAIPKAEKSMAAMNQLLAHRGPDGEGTWIHPDGHVAFTHRRLSILDLSDAGRQPMEGTNGDWITYNGEVYNFIELRDELEGHAFTTGTDTEVILAAHAEWGNGFLDHLYGMFAFGLWDESQGQLICARDRFGVKPFYYTIVGDVLYFASEIKALMPFLERIETDHEAFLEYLTFQFCLEGKTLFKGVRELPPAHRLVVADGEVVEERYWEVEYLPDPTLDEATVEEELRRLMVDSVAKHMRSDVPVGTYVSGGLDSGIVTCLMQDQQEAPLIGYHGKYTVDPAFDESHYARITADHAGAELKERDMGPEEWFEALEKAVYHLDQPAAGPGVVGQFLVSEMAAKERKVVLCGTGGDEIFGGYVRFLIGYLDQCIKASIEGRLTDAQFEVPFESILPNLTVLEKYKPLIQEFWKDGLFGPIDRRYFRLIDRSRGLGDEIRWDAIRAPGPINAFQRVFNATNVRPNAYFDLMTHFDLKTLLPALLQVEDRVSMANGLESRVPFLDHRIVELAARIPAPIKYKNGELKRLIRTALGRFLPDEVLERPDKMGFPVPFSEWIQNEKKEWIIEILGSERALQRKLVDNQAVLDALENEPRFSRKIWGFLSLELWQRAFHDREDEFKALLD